MIAWRTPGPGRFNIDHSIRRVRLCDEGEVFQESLASLGKRASIFHQGRVGHLVKTGKRLLKNFPFIAKPHPQSVSAKLPLGTP
jgi:hypothetical protein